MTHSATWDWDIQEKPVTDIAEWNEKYTEVHELVVSPDGEKVAAIVQTDDESFRPCVNGQVWENGFEKAWSLRFSPDGRLVCLAMNDDEWTVVVDDQPWEETFDYVWNLTFTPDGKNIAANCRTPEGYGIIKIYQGRNMIISGKGRLMIQLKTRLSLLNGSMPV